MAITWVLMFGLIKSFCGAKEDPPSAVSGLGRLSVKAHGLRSMGLLCCEGIRSPTQRSGWAWKIDVGWAYVFSVCGAGLGRWGFFS